MKAGQCVHYNGCGRYDHCQAGVDYKRAFGDEPGILFRLPCISRLDRRGEVPGYCQFKLEPTPEQIAQYQAEREVWMDNVMTALNAISEWRRGFKQGVSRSTEIDCPACGKKISVTQSGYNGHVHGLCVTEGCLYWME